MTMLEMKQTIVLCDATLRKLNGTVPAYADLIRALGEEYADLLTEYLYDGGAAA